VVDLVVGYARGYEATDILPFLKTLRASGYSGRVLLLANGGAQKEAANWDVDVRPCPPTSMLPHSDRFVHLARLLKGIPFEGVFLTDTRDVIFQDDVSYCLPSQGLHCYEEDRSQTIGSCPYNSEWIRLGYGDKCLQEMKDYPILCVGSISGGRVEVLSHLDRLSAEVQRLQPRTHKPQDQSSHNWLIRYSKGPVCWNNEDGEVYTVGYLPRETVGVQNKKIINRAGGVPAVIHQWDRHNNLKQLVKEIVG